MLEGGRNLHYAGRDYSASPAVGVAADGTTPGTLEVTVRDVNGNPVPGQIVLGLLRSSPVSRSISDCWIPWGPVEAR